MNQITLFMLNVFDSLIHWKELVRKSQLIMNQITLVMLNVFDSLKIIGS